MISGAVTAISIGCGGLLSHTILQLETWGAWEEPSFERGFEKQQRTLKTKAFVKEMTSSWEDGVKKDTSPPGQWKTALSKATTLVSVHIDTGSLEHHPYKIIH